MDDDAVNRELAIAPNEKHRLLPQDVNAEMGVLSSFLIAPREVAALCLEKGITDEHFHLPAHATIYRELLAMSEAGKPIDTITLLAWLSDRNLLEEVGGNAVPSQLFTFLPTAANVGYYAEIAQEKCDLRRLIGIGTEYSRRAWDEQDNVRDLIEQAHADITKLAVRKTKSSKPIRQLAFEAVERMEERAAGRSPQILTGIRTLDEESPVRPGDFLLIAGKRKSGKSALSADILRHVCIDGGRPGVAFSLEMPDWQWVERLIANIGRISLGSIFKGKLTIEEQMSFNPTVETIAKAPLEIFDAVYDLPGILAQLRRLKAKHPTLAVAVVDYCQLVESHDKRTSNRQEEVARVSRAFKLIAGELSIALIGLSQLNEEGYTRESRALEQDSSAVWKVIEELDDDGNPKTGKGSERRRQIYIPYQRHGRPNIRINMKFFGAQSRFEEEPRKAEQPELYSEP